MAGAGAQIRRTGPKRGQKKPAPGEAFDTASYIRTHFLLRPLPFVPEIQIYGRQPQSGLGALLEARGGTGDPTPYWAFEWAGGLALARYVLDHPDLVRGRRVLDLGTGSGLVAIAAAKAGAAHVIAADIDPLALEAVALNAEANGVAIETYAGDLTSGQPPDAEVILAGDIFYVAELAEKAAGFFARCAATGTRILVGDPGRAYLPQKRLQPIAEYEVPDVGLGAAALVRAGIFAFADG